MAGIGLRIYEDADGFEVWLGPTDDLAVNNVVNACVVGTGPTRAAAIQDAKLELAELAELLVLGTLDTVVLR